MQVAQDNDSSRYSSTQFFHLATSNKAHDLDKKYQGHVIYNGKDFSYEYLDRGTAQDQIS